MIISPDGTRELLILSQAWPIHLLIQIQIQIQIQRISQDSFTWWDEGIVDFEPGNGYILDQYFVTLKSVTWWDEGIADLEPGNGYIGYILDKYFVSKQTKNHLMERGSCWFQARQAIGRLGNPMQSSRSPGFALEGEIYCEIYARYMTRLILTGGWDIGEIYSSHYHPCRWNGNWQWWQVTNMKQRTKFRAQELAMPFMFQTNIVAMPFMFQTLVDQLG